MTAKTDIDALRERYVRLDGERGIESRVLAADDGTWNIVHETLQLRRSIGLPKHFTDAGRPATAEPLRKPDEWQTFAEFFAFLLDEEEPDR